MPRMFTAALFMIAKTWVRRDLWLLRGQRGERAWTASLELVAANHHI